MTRTLLAFLSFALLATPLHAQCTLQISEEGIIRIASGEERTLTWNAVPGASSYLVEKLIEGLNDPAAPDFAFGSPYTESRNFETRTAGSVQVKHSVLYKIRFRYIVTALNRDNPSFQPCSDDVLYVVSPDEQLATTASKRIVPIVGKTPGANGANYTTALIITGTGLGLPDDNDPATPKLYRGRIVFRPVGTAASENDPSIEYELDGDDTVVYDDIMASLGATGTGTLEVIPRTYGHPTPQVDAIIENHMPDSRRFGVRIPALWGRDLLDRHQTVTFGIRSVTDNRLSVGVRALGSGFSGLILQHLKADGTVVETTQRSAPAETTVLYSLQELFSAPFTPGDRVIVRYTGFELMGPSGTRFGSPGGVVLFLTETGNHFNNPNIVYRERMNGSRYDEGFDRFVVY
ncbi:MAG TPA: hypothetical protein VF618_00040 [Thermoanaerobaculia bacterium]